MLSPLEQRMAALKLDASSVQMDATSLYRAIDNGCIEEAGDFSDSVRRALEDIIVDLYIVSAMQDGAPEPKRKIGDCVAYTNGQGYTRIYTISEMRFDGEWIYGCQRENDGYQEIETFSEEVLFDGPKFRLNDLVVLKDADPWKIALCARQEGEWLYWLWRKDDSEQAWESQLDWLIPF